MKKLVLLVACGLMFAGEAKISKVASLSNNAILNVSPVDAVKSCWPFKSSTLKDVQTADVIAIIYSYCGGDSIGIRTVPSV